MLIITSQAVYSGVHVYEMEVQGVACMRRRSDGWLNATQILKVAGVDKGKRTKVLEKDDERTDIFLRGFCGYLCHW